jgi:hypothetical protein
VFGIAMAAVADAKLAAVMKKASFMVTLVDRLGME